jgi:thiosulfate/3-mercaptopyruvate sulfurtransferase
MSPHLLCAALLMLSPADDPKAGKYAAPGLRIDSPELVRLMSANKVRLLDARPKAKYDAGHIPGAVWVDATAWTKAFGPAPDKDEWAKRLGALGLEVDSPVVVYGEDPREPARVWWVLRYWGFKDARLLDGGWLAWATQNSAASRAAPAVKPTEPKLTPQADRLATKGQVLDIVKKKDRQIIDARSEKEFCGEEARAKRGGAIPGAKNLDWTDLIHKDGRFKSAEELRKLFQAHEISLKEPAVTYCQSGGRASVMAFALELMGAKGVSNYYQSWNEWGNDPDTPIMIPKKK